jgi:hypothetical protein
MIIASELHAAGPVGIADDRDLATAGQLQRMLLPPSPLVSSYRTRRMMSRCSEDPYENRDFQRHSRECAGT